MAYYCVAMFNGTWNGLTEPLYIKKNLESDFKVTKLDEEHIEREE